MSEIMQSDLFETRAKLKATAQERKEALQIQSLMSIQCSVDDIIRIVRHVRECAEPKSVRLDRALIDEAFDLFWSVYPSSASKKNARKRFEEQVRLLIAGNEITQQGAQDRIIFGARQYRDWREMQAEPPAVKYAEGWLNAGRYDDDYTTMIEAMGNSRMFATTAQKKIHNTGQVARNWRPPGA